MRGLITGVPTRRSIRTTAKATVHDRPSREEGGVATVRKAVCEHSKQDEPLLLRKLDMAGISERVDVREGVAMPGEQSGHNVVQLISIKWKNVI